MLVVNRPPAYRAMEDAWAHAGCLEWVGLRCAAVGRSRLGWQREDIIYGYLQAPTKPGKMALVSALASRPLALGPTQN